MSSATASAGCVSFNWMATLSGNLRKSSFSTLNLRIKSCIELLPAGYRVVFSLYLLEGYDHKEIGQILGITESTSKSQYNRAKAKLRALLLTQNSN